MREYRVLKRHPQSGLPDGAGMPHIVFCDPQVEDKPALLKSVSAVGPRKDLRIDFDRKHHRIRLDHGPPVRDPG